MKPEDRPSASEVAGTGQRGIRCPECHAAGEWSVYYTRQIPGGVRRVRHCRKCGQKTVTIERLAGDPSSGGTSPPVSGDSVLE